MARFLAVALVLARPPRLSGATRPLRPARRLPAFVFALVSGASKSASASRDDLLAELRRAALGSSTSSHRAVVKIAELERPERDADQPVHLQPERLEHLAHLAVLALADAEGEPDIGALLAVERRLDRPVADAVDGDAAAQPVERVLRDAAERAHAVAAQPAGRRQFQHAREPAVIGEQQQPFGVDVEPADADQPRQVLRQRAEDGRRGLPGRNGSSPARAACGRGTAACARAPRSGAPSTAMRSRSA